MSKSLNVVLSHVLALDLLVSVLDILSYLGLFNLIPFLHVITYYATSILALLHLPALAYVSWDVVQALRRPGFMPNVGLRWIFANYIGFQLYAGLASRCGNEGYGFGGRNAFLSGSVVWGVVLFGLMEVLGCWEVMDGLMERTRREDLAAGFGEKF